MFEYEYTKVVKFELLDWEIRTDPVLDHTYGYDGMVYEGDNLKVIFYKELSGPDQTRLQGIVDAHDPAGKLPPAASAAKDGKISYSRVSTEVSEFGVMPVGARGMLGVAAAAQMPAAEVEARTANALIWEMTADDAAQEISYPLPVEATIQSFYIQALAAPCGASVKGVVYNSAGDYRYTVLDFPLLGDTCINVPVTAPAIIEPGWTLRLIVHNAQGTFAEDFQVALAVAIEQTTDWINVL